MILLIDLDGTVRDLWRAFVNKARSVTPDIAWPEQGPDTYWFLNRHKHHPRYEQLQAIMRKENFFLHMSPYSGAVDTIKTLAENHTVYLVTQPIAYTDKHPHRTAHSENAEWVRMWFGDVWANERLIQTADRTILDADILIDDNPHIQGALAHPRWKLVHYAQPYNKDVTPLTKTTPVAQGRFKDWQFAPLVLELLEPYIARPRSTLEKILIEAIEELQPQVLGDHLDIVKRACNALGLDNVGTELYLEGEVIL